MSKEFDVVRDAPKTPEQALAVLESWAGNLAVTFSRERCGYVVDALKSSSDELKFLAFEELKGKEPIKGLEADPSAFVRWAEKAGYDMTCHPLHFLFLDQKTNAARMGWKAAVEHYNPQPAQPKAEKQEQGEPVAIIEELIPNTDCELRAVRWLDVEASFKYPIGTLLAPFKNIKEK